MYRTIIMVAVARKIPNDQPASTSDVQCTANMMRLSPMRNAAAKQARIISSLFSQELIRGANRYATTVKNAAANAACPLGKLGSFTMISNAFTGRALINNAFKSSTAIVVLNMEKTMIAAERHLFAIRNHAPIVSPKMPVIAALPTVLINSAVATTTGVTWFAMNILTQTSKFVIYECADQASCIVSTKPQSERIFKAKMNSSYFLKTWKYRLTRL